jgi:hypothetical protein
MVNHVNYGTFSSPAPAVASLPAVSAKADDVAKVALLRKEDKLKNGDLITEIWSFSADVGCLKPSLSESQKVFYAKQIQAYANQINSGFIPSDELRSHFECLMERAVRVGIVRDVSLVALN